MDQAKQSPTPEREPPRRWDATHLPTSALRCPLEGRRIFSVQRQDAYGKCTTLPARIGNAVRPGKAGQRELVEVPVGFKWFVDGLLDSSLAFAGEESAGCFIP